ncbi:hypothetical protein [Candidatus Poriferisocius sp.]|uniref:hypothetical protein n=1 Tax=Candidatus Poriferisocius sp. TaxID=3101276 RepID=UPI003B018407
MSMGIPADMPGSMAISVPVKYAAARLARKTVVGDMSSTLLQRGIAAQFGEDNHVAFQVKQPNALEALAPRRPSDHYNLSVELGGH